MTKILILYHYYWPDDVVSSSLFTDLCEGLAQRGHIVDVWPSNRPCHSLTMNQRKAHTANRYSTRPETRNGVKIHRVWRLPLSQHSFLGRIFNAIWMIKFWWLRLAFHSGYQPDVILVGTDPLLAVTIVPFLKFLRPKAKLVHWCFDLYPEAAIADGRLGPGSPLVKMVKWAMNASYPKCDLVADLGSCMRERLKAYPVKKSATLTAWALEEPPHALAYDKSERRALFGDAPLGLLYSGSFGRPHEFYMMVKLARLMPTARVTFSARGSRLAELHQALNPEDTNIHFAEFAPPEKLSARLCAPDVHLVSLRPDWAGIVVPSKFFGALAVGRPVLFEGSLESSIARWIKEFGVGWVLTSDNMDKTAEDLLAFSGDEKRKKQMFEHCFDIYQAHYSKKIVMDRWDKEIKTLLG